MKKRLFGTYLVEKNLISEAELVGVLIHQTKSVPTVAEIVSREKLLSPELILKVFNHQAAEGSNFTVSAQALGFWNVQLSETVERLIAMERKPLGEILMARGLIRPEALVDALDDYINGHEEAPAHTQEKVLEGRSITAAAPALAKAPETVAQVKRQADPVQEEIREFFTAERLRAYLDEEASYAPSQYLKNLGEIRGRAYLAGLRRLNAIIAGAETVIRARQVDSSAAEEEENRVLIQEVITLSWDMVEASLSGKSEDDFIKSAEHASSIAFLVRRISSQKQRNVS